MKQLNEVFTKRKNASLGFFSEIKVSPVHEGDRSIIQRPDGRVEETQFKEIEVTSTLSVHEERSMTDAELIENLMKLADKMADQQSELTIAALNDAVTSVGNVMSTSEFGPQTLLDALEKMQIHFNADGKHNSLTLLSGTTMQESMKKALEEIHSNPVWKSKYEQLMLKKREEWHARESTRKLVG